VDGLRELNVACGSLAHHPSNLILVVSRKAFAQSFPIDVGLVGVLIELTQTLNLVGAPVVHQPLTLLFEETFNEFVDLAARPVVHRTQLLLYRVHINIL